MNITVKITKMFDDVQIPQYATEGSVGLDLHAYLPNKEPITLGTSFENITFDNDGVKVDQKVVNLIPTGLKICLPNGYEAQIRPRSGLAVKNGITVANAPGTIDTDYRGEIKVALINLSKRDFIVEHGMRIAQMVISPVKQAELVLVDSLEDTDRGEGGFGSTGQ